MDFNLLTDSEARSPALSLSDSGTPQHDPGCKGQDNSGQFIYMYTSHNIQKIVRNSEKCSFEFSINNHVTQQMSMQ